MAEASVTAELLQLPGMVVLDHRHPRYFNDDHHDNHHSDGSVAEAAAVLLQ